MAFKNLKIDGVKVFGKQKSKSWADMLLKQNKNFGSLTDKDGFEESLATNVEESYWKLAEFKIVDLDTDMEYNLFFNNNLKLWDVEFADNKNDKNVDILPNQKFDLIRNDYTKKAIARAFHILRRAKDLLENSVLQHVDEGELLKVDEVKLEAVDSFLNDELLMKNFKDRKYAK